MDSKLRGLRNVTVANGATPAEAATAKRLADQRQAKLPSIPVEMVTFGFDVVLTRYKNGYATKISHKEVKHFLKEVRPSARMTYRDFIGKDFANQHFYVMVDWCEDLGLVNKQGSSYIFDKGIRAKLAEAWGAAIQEMRL